MAITMFMHGTHEDKHRRMGLMNVLQEFLASLKTNRARVACFAMLLAVATALVAFGATPLVFADEKAETKETVTAESTTKADDAKKTDAKADDAKADDAAADAVATGDTEADDAVAVDLPEDAFIIGNDTMWFGRSIDFSGYKATNDFIGAGETINLTDSHANGSIRIAGRVVNLTNTAAAESITIAGQDVAIVNGTAGAVAIAAQKISFSGAANELWIGGDKVVINGAIMGDVHVFAGDLELGPNAHIEGTLSGEVGSDPVIAEEATVNENTLVINKDEEQPKDFVSMLDPIVIIVSTLSCLAIALLIEWLASGHTMGAAQLLKSGPGGYILSSILGGLLMPIFIVVLCLPIVTIPAALAVLLTLLAIALVSEGFTAAALGRLLFPKMNRFLAAAIMAILIGALSGLPYVGAPLRGILFLFMLGYVIRALRVTMIERRRAKEEEVFQF